MPALLIVKDIAIIAVQAIIIICWAFYTVSG